MINNTPPLAAPRRVRRYISWTLIGVHFLHEFLTPFSYLPKPLETLRSFLPQIDVIHMAKTVSTHLAFAQGYQEYKPTVSGGGLLFCTGGGGGSGRALSTSDGGGGGCRRMSKEEAEQAAKDKANK